MEQLKTIYGITLNSIYINCANGKRFYIRGLYLDGTTKRVKLGFPSSSPMVENYVHMDFDKFAADLDKGVYKCILCAKVEKEV
jgi:hypothetical protein